MTLKTHIHLIFLQSLTIIVATTLMQLFLPWWIIAIVPFFVGYLFRTPLLTSFLVSFAAVFLLWTVSAYRADQNFDVSMAELLGEILGSLKPLSMFILTGMTGGLVAGFSGFLGSWTRQLSQKSS